MNRAPNTYVRQQRCPHCGSEHILDVEKSRQKELANRGNTCRCVNYPFPHAAGTLRMCVQHKDFDKEPTRDELRDHENLIYKSLNRK